MKYIARSTRKRRFMISVLFVMDIFLCGSALQRENFSS